MTTTPTDHDGRSCRTAAGCVCICPECVGSHCGHGDREAARFCITQGIVPTNAAVREARVALDARRDPSWTTEDR